MLKKSGSVTLKDVAHAAGVSLKTASRVLNNSSELRPETERVVREAMAQLGYQPTQNAEDYAVEILAQPNPLDPVAQRFQGGGFVTIDYTPADQRP